MKAIWYDRTGPAREVLQYGDRPTPQPGHGQAGFQCMTKVVIKRVTSHQARVVAAIAVDQIDHATT